MVTYAPHIGITEETRATCGSLDQKQGEAFPPSLRLSSSISSASAGLHGSALGMGQYHASCWEKISMVMMCLGQKSRIPQQIRQSQKHGWFDILFGG